MKINKSEIRYILWVMLALAITFGSTVKAYAQLDENAQEKNTARLSLNYFSLNNESYKLVATVKTKIEGFYNPVNGAKIQFYRNQMSEENLLSTKETGQNGEAVLEFKLKPDTAMWTKYLAIMENDPNLEDAEEEIEIKKGILNLETEEADLVKTIRIFVGTPDGAGNFTPIEGVVVRAFVKRLFGLMPVTEESETTDEEGYFEAEFPSGIPGEANGNLTLVARVSDNDELGNLEFSKSIAWGVPLSIDHEKQSKELWLSHSNVPNILLIIINLLLIGIFGTICYVIFQLFQIKKLGLSN